MFLFDKHIDLFVCSQFYGILIFIEDQKSCSPLFFGKQIISHIRKMEDLNYRFIKHARNFNKKKGMFLVFTDI